MPSAGEFGAWNGSTRVGKLHLLLPHPQRGGMPKPSGMPHFFYCAARPDAYKFGVVFSTGRNAMLSGKFYFYRWYFEIPSGRRRDGDA
jgi:hypothetical protein